MKYKELAEYLSDLNPRVPYSLLLLIALVKIAEIGGLNNLEAKSDIVESPDHTVPANMYVLTFQDSAGGKDKPLRIIDKNLASEVEEDFIKRARLSKEKRERGLIEEAEELFKDNKNEQKKFITANRPRFLVRELSDATMEGFVAMRQEYFKIGWGGTFVKISEFGDYITSDNTARSEFLSMLIEVFDFGHNNVKITKGEKDTFKVDNVPCSAILHTSPSGLLEGKNRDKLMTFLNRGNARRAFICYPEQSIIFESESIKEHLEMVRTRRAKAYAKAPELEKYINDFYKHTRCEDNVVYNTHNTFTFTPEADIALEEYMARNDQIASQMKKDTYKSGIVVELSGRGWKALKLATIIAAFEHPEIKEVTKAEVEEAIKICDTYADHLARFYKTQPTTDYDRLYDYMLSNKNVWITTMTLRDQNFVYKDRFKRFFDESRPALEDQLESQGYILQQEKVGRSGMKYRVMPVTQDPEDEPEEKKITISVGDTNKPTETHFKSASIKFSSLYKLTNLDRSWCATTFKDDYRKDDNATGNIDLVVFDVDSGMDMKDCIENLKSRKIKSLVTTTRSHQKKKDDKPACDRYRVILPLQKTETLSAEDYKMKITQAALSLGIPNDRATKNISRLWFGNPNQEYTYVDGGCIDLSVFKKPIYEPKADLGGKYNGSDNSGIKKWFADNWQKYGGRNNTLYIVKQFFMNDKQMDIESVKQAVLEVNDLMGDSIPVKEIEQTVFKSLKTLSVPLPDKKVPLPEEEAEVTVDDLPF